MQAKLRQIAKILGAENLFTDPAQLRAYAAGADYSGLRSNPPLPAAIARPRRNGQIAELLRFCSAEGVKLAIRGAGTSPVERDYGGALILLTTGLDRILEIDRGSRRGRVQAGAGCQNLQSALNSQGMFLPALPSAPAATLGGALATSLSSCAALKYGPLASFVEELEVFATSGELIACAGQGASPSQLAPGFALAPLFCGSGGCLGVIASATLRLLPKPPASARACAAFPGNDQAAGACEAILSNGLLPDQLEFYDAGCAAALYGDPAWAKPLLVAEFHGAACSVEKSLDDAEAIIQKHGGEAAPAPENPAALLPKLARRPFQLERLLCPPARFAAALEALGAIASKHGAEIACFGDAGAARLGIAIFAQESASIKKDIFTLELMLNAAMRDESDAGLGRAEWQSRQQGIRALSEKLRPLFDPAGLLASQPLPGQAAS